MHERHRFRSKTNLLTTQITKFCVLDDDYTKIALACVDRNIEIHSQAGRYYKVRVPKWPRDMIYNPFTCDLAICGGSKDIYRLSLDEGKFYSSLEASVDQINVLEFNKHLNLLISGGDEGIIDIWDYR